MAHTQSGQLDCNKPFSSFDLSPFEALGKSERAFFDWAVFFYLLKPNRFCLARQASYKSWRNFSTTNFWKGQKCQILGSNFEDVIFWPRKTDFKEETICQRIYTAGDGEVGLAAAFSLSTSSIGWLQADDWLINKYAKSTRIEWSNGRVADENVWQLDFQKDGPRNI
jgi:hypothetical protein